MSIAGVETAGFFIFYVNVFALPLVRKRITDKETRDDLVMDCEFDGFNQLIDVRYKSEGSAAF